MARVVLESVAKVFRDSKNGVVSALQDVGFIAEDKELLVLVGPSGSGKTTLLRLIAGLEELSSGTISIDSVVVNNVDPKDRDVAMVFQNFALYPHMTVYENLAFPLRLRKAAKTEIERRVREAAEFLGLIPHLDRLPQTLSGGERQRVAVGRAIVRRPKVFLFDEPLSNLDTQMRVQMRAEIASLHRQLGATMIYVTHDQVEAMTLGDRVAVLRQGRIQQLDKPLVLYNRPSNLFVARFIGSPTMNTLHGRVVEKDGARIFQTKEQEGHGTEFMLSNGLEPWAKTAAGREVILGVRPEQITLAEGSTSASEKTRSKVVARLELIESLGAETYLYAKLGTHTLIARIASEAGARLETGENVTLALDLSKAHFFDATTEQRL